MMHRPAIAWARSGPASPARRSLLAASLALFATTARAQAWTPPPETEQEGKAFLERWAGLIDRERYGEAYALLAPAAKSRSTPSQWADLQHRFRVRVGASTSRIVKTIVWSNNPARAPSPGVYVVAAYDGSFQNVGACFEVVALHRPPGGDFMVLRHQRTVLADEKEKALHERKIWLVAHPR